MRTDLVELRRGKEEAILFGVVAHGDPRSAPEALHELELLADTANFSISGCLVQHRRHPDPHTYLGSGKLAELAEIVQRAKAAFVICDAPLTPLQGRNIEKAINAPVMDRSELILRIFAVHARTTQAKLQVELASLNYQLPRLQRLWSHLERQRGGIGVRGGAGEKQISLDRNYIRTRIGGIERQLESIEAHRTRQTAARADQYSIALVGYTNAGKSTLMNRLTGAGVLTENRLFSTLDTRTRPWRLAGGRTVLLSDTVGFIRNLPHELVASFHATLEEALTADLLFVVADAANPETLQQLETVDQVLGELGAASLPRVLVLNKIDAVTDHSMIAPIYRRDPRTVAVSARTGQGIPELEERLQEHLASCGRRVEILVPHAAGALHAEIRRATTVLSEQHTDEGSVMECIVSPSLLDQLVARGARLHETPKRSRRKPQ